MEETQNGSYTQNRQVAKLERQIESRDQVIGVNCRQSSLRKTLDAVPLTTETRQVITDQMTLLETSRAPQLG